MTDRKKAFSVDVGIVIDEENNGPAIFGGASIPTIVGAVEGDKYFQSNGISYTFLSGVWVADSSATSFSEDLILTNYKGDVLVNHSGNVLRGR